MKTRKFIAYFSVILFMFFLTVVNLNTFSSENVNISNLNKVLATAIAGGEGEPIYDVCPPNHAAWHYGDFVTIYCKDHKGFLNPCGQQYDCFLDYTSCCPIL